MKTGREDEGKRQSKKKKEREGGEEEEEGRQEETQGRSRTEGETDLHISGHWQRPRVRRHPNVFSDDVLSSLRLPRFSAWSPKGEREGRACSLYGKLTRGVSTSLQQRGYLHLRVSLGVLPSPAQSDQRNNKDRRAPGREVQRCMTDKQMGRRCIYRLHGAGVAEVSGRTRVDRTTAAVCCQATERNVRTSAIQYKYALYIHRIQLDGIEVETHTRDVYIQTRQEKARGVSSD